MNETTCHRRNPPGTTTGVSVGAQDDFAPGKVYRPGNRPLFSRAIKVWRIRRDQNQGETGQLLCKPAGNFKGIIFRKIIRHKYLHKISRVILPSHLFQDSPDIPGFIAHRDDHGYKQHRLTG